MLSSLKTDVTFVASCISSLRCFARLGRQFAAKNKPNPIRTSNADVTQATSVQVLSLISTIGLKIERQWLGTVLDCFFDGHTRPAGEIVQILEKRGQKRKAEHSIKASSRRQIRSSLGLNVEMAINVASQSTLPAARSTIHLPWATSLTTRDSLPRFQLAALATERFDPRVS